MLLNEVNAFSYFFHILKTNCIHVCPWVEPGAHKRRKEVVLFRGACGVLVEHIYTVSPEWWMMQQWLDMWCVYAAPFTHIGNLQFTPITYFRTHYLGDIIHNHHFTHLIHLFSARCWLLRKQIYYATDVTIHIDVQCSHTLVILIGTHILYIVQALESTPHSNIGECSSLYKDKCYVTSHTFYTCMQSQVYTQEDQIRSCDASYTPCSLKCIEHAAYKEISTYRLKYLPQYVYNIMWPGFVFVWTAKTHAHVSE